MVKAVSLLLQERFSPYGPSHWAALAVFVLGATLLIVAGRRQRGTPAVDRTSKLMAMAILALAVPAQIYLLLPSQWHIGGSLPLQLSDLAWMAAAYALWTHRPWAFALTYYWGLTLSSQALITPALQGFDFPHVQFIMFWALHLLVVWAALYLTWGLGMRPDWRGYGIAVGVTVGWVLLMLVFNELAGTNYGFVSAKPATGSLLDLLGDWPWYLLSVLAIGLTVWALLTVPWVYAAKQPRVEA